MAERRKKSALDDLAEEEVLRLLSPRQGSESEWDTLEVRRGPNGESRQAGRTNTTGALRMGNDGYSIDPSGLDRENRLWGRALTSRDATTYRTSDGAVVDQPAAMRLLDEGYQAMRPDDFDAHLRNLDSQPGQDPATSLQDANDLQEWIRVRDAMMAGGVGSQDSKVLRYTMRHIGSGGQEGDWSSMRQIDEETDEGVTRSGKIPAFAANYLVQNDPRATYVSPYQDLPSDRRQDWGDAMNIWAPRRSPSASAAPAERQGERYSRLRDTMSRGRSPARR